MFDIYNTGKKMVSLNLKNPEGMKAFRKLLSEADVFVTNLRPVALSRLGIGYEDVKEIYPRLIYAIILGYGEEGPEADSPAFDVTAFWSKSGFMRDLSPVTEGYSPVNAPSGIGDTVSGMFLMGEICAALYNRDRTGRGDYVRSGLYHNGIFTMGTMNIMTQKPFGTKFPRTRVQHSIPGGSYRCADGEYVYLALITWDKTMPAVYDMLELQELEQDPRFNNENRGKNRQAYFEILQEAFLKKPCAEWLKLARERDVPLVHQCHFSDVTEDEQAWANGYLEHVTFPNGRVDVMPRSPVEMDSVQDLKTVPVPLVGGDTKAVLQQLGYSDAEIEQMYASGAAYTQK